MPLFDELKPSGIFSSIESVNPFLPSIKKTSVSVIDSTEVTLLDNSFSSFVLLIQEQRTRDIMNIIVIVFSAFSFKHSSYFLLIAYICYKFCKMFFYCSIIGNNPNNILKNTISLEKKSALTLTSSVSVEFSILPELSTTFA